MVPLVLFALIVGFALTRLPAAQRAPLVELLRAIAQTMLVIVGWVLKVAPLGVFALILPVAARTGSGLIGAAGWLVFVQSCLQGAVLLAMYPVAVGLGGVAFARFARAAAPAQGVGFGTQSSLATLPVMLEAATRGLQIPARIAGVILPLAVSLFRVTSPANTLGSACFVAWLYGVDLSMFQLAAGALVAIVIALGSVSLPGQVTFAASHVPVLLAMGLPLEPVALMLALDPIPDASAPRATSPGILRSQRSLRGTTPGMLRRSRPPHPARWSPRRDRALLPPLRNGPHRMRGRSAGRGRASRSRRRRR